MGQISGRWILKGNDMNKNEIFDTIKKAAMNACLTIDRLDCEIDGAEAEPTKEGFKIMFFCGDAIPLHYEITLTDLNQA